jgi:hypothetical protein
MPTHRLSALLAGATLGPLCDASRRTRELQRVFVDSVPASLARSVRVKTLRGGTLFLSADNVAVAAKLRQLVPRLLTTIRERVPEVNEIRVEAQVNAGEDMLRIHAKKSGLSIETIEKIEKAATAMPDSELKSALAALVRHHR